MQFTIATTTATRRTARSNPFASQSVRLWAVQGLLAAIFLMAGLSKLAMSAQDLTADTWLSAEFLRFIGVCETLGAIGLILPGILRIRRELTPLAASGLVVIMIGATVITAAAGDIALAAMPLAVGLLCLYVATRREAAYISR